MTGAEGDVPTSIDPGELRLSEPGIVVRHVADPERDRDPAGLEEQGFDVVAGRGGLLGDRRCAVHAGGERCDPSCVHQAGT